MILAYEDFKRILNRRLFDGSRASLLKSIAETPDRFIGLFRPTKPKTKLIQNLTQSHEIKFGDALEEIFTQYFQLTGYSLLPKRIITANQDALNIDQLFSLNNIVFMIEQKVRDDHDSTKKRGQFQNFENKYYEVLRSYPNKIVKPIMWFVDGSLVKNKNYYVDEMRRMNMDYDCFAKLCYGAELFDEQIINHINIEIWNETLLHLREWKNSLPDMPEINFDINSAAVFDEIKDLSPSIFRKLFANEEIKAQILPILFPNGETLSRLKEYFETLQLPIYRGLCNALQLFLNT